jgi:hypothetical protein
MIDTLEKWVRRGDRMSDVYILFFMDDEYSHFDIKGVFSSLEKLYGGVDELQKRTDIVNIKNHGHTYPPVIVVDFDKEEEELEKQGYTMTGEQYFWKKIEVDNPFSIAMRL